MSRFAAILQPSGIPPELYTHIVYIYSTNKMPRFDFSEISRDELIFFISLDITDVSTDSAM